MEVDGDVVSIWLDSPKADEGLSVGARHAVSSRQHRVVQVSIRDGQLTKHCCSFGRFSAKKTLIRDSRMSFCRQLPPATKNCQRNDLGER